MRKILLALAFLCTPAHAEMVSAELTSCTSKEAIITYFEETRFKHRSMTEVMGELNKNGEVCRLDTLFFDLGTTFKNYDVDGITYDYVEVTVLSPSQFAGKRYAVHYYKALPTV